MKKQNQQQKKGISLIALIITIIVIALLAAIVVNTSINTPASANLANFAQNMGELQQAVAISYSDIYVTEVIKATPKTNAQIYEEIAKGAKENSTVYTSTLPVEIGNIAWKVEDATKLNSIETLPYDDLYITDIGIIFRANGHESDGEILVTPSVKMPSVPEQLNELIVDGSWDDEKEVNTPKLVTGMIPIYFEDDGTEVEVTSENKDNWYDYDAKKWANAKSENSEGVTTAYWVWIPRYAYQITTNLGIGENGVGNINVKFLQGTTNKDSADDDVSTTYPTVAKTDSAMPDFVVHPAFGNNVDIGGWKENLAGIWVAKFTAGYAMGDENGDPKIDGGNNITPVGSGVLYTEKSKNWLDEEYEANSEEIKYPVFLPQTIAMNYINVGNCYSICRAMETSGNIYGFEQSANTHLMKNSEWGAVAYLTQSNKGINGEIEKNTASFKNNPLYAYGVTGNNNIGQISTITPNAWILSTASSSTGNVSGIYDLVGCMMHRVASYVKSMHQNLESYGGSFAKSSWDASSDEYATVYISNQGGTTTTYVGSERNYDIIKNGYLMYGDATVETSTKSGYMAKTSWGGKSSMFPALGYSFFHRSSAANSSAVSDSIFSFYYSVGNVNMANVGFRAVVCQ